MATGTLPSSTLVFLLGVMVTSVQQACIADSGKGGNITRQVLEKAPPGVRVWFDEKNFKEGEITLVKRAFEAAGAVHVGGPGKHEKAPKLLSYEVPDRWDLLWTVRTPAMHALPFLAAWQKVNAVPGLTAITKKDKLPKTMFTAYAEDSYSFIPPSFLLPGDLNKWKAWNDPDCPAEADAQCLWVLKNNKHLGKGLKILPRQLAEQAAVSNFLVAQKYVDNPLLIDNHKFGIRLWVVLTSTTPFRAYLHTSGLVLFSSNKYDMDREHTRDDGNSGHLTNAFQNAEGRVWTLEELRQHLGATAFSKTWHQLHEISGMVMAAALVECRLHAINLGIRDGSVFQLLGLDFLLDANLKPWLIEVNSTPSMSLGGADKVGMDKLDSEKGAMLDDLVRILGIHERTGAGVPHSGEKGSCSFESSETSPAEHSAGRYCVSDPHYQLLPALQNVLDAASELMYDAGDAELLKTYPRIMDYLCSMPRWEGRSHTDAVGITSKACSRCLSVEDLRLIVDTEREFGRRGAFQPLMQDFHSYCIRSMHDNLGVDASQWSLPCSRQDQVTARWMEARQKLLPEVGADFVGLIADMFFEMVCQ